MLRTQQSEMCLSERCAEGAWFSSGESLEKNMDIYFPPDLNMAKAPTVLVAANKAREKVVGVCAPVDNGASIDFGSTAQHYLRRYEGRDPMDVDISRVKIKLLEVVRQPKHGRLFLDDNDPYSSGAYHPDPGYLGKDRVEAIVSVGKDVVRVVYDLVVQTEAVDGLMSRDDSKKVMKALCPKGRSWKISGLSPEYKL